MFSKLNTTSFISFAFRIPRALVLLWSQVAILFGGKRNQWGKSESTCLSSQLWCRGERKGNCNFQKFLGWLWTNRGIFKETKHYYSADSTAREGRIFFFSPEISRKKKQLPSSILFKKKQKKQLPPVLGLLQWEKTVQRGRLKGLIPRAGTKHGPWLSEGGKGKCPAWSSR